MENVVTIKRIAPVNEVSRNGRLVTRETWQKAIDKYMETHPDGSIPVTLGCQIYDRQDLSLAEIQSVELSSVVGSTVAVGESEIDVYIKSDTKRDVVKELVSNHDYVVGCRMIGKYKKHNLTDEEMEKYCTKKSVVNEVTDITIISFDLMKG